MSRMTDERFLELEEFVTCELEETEELVKALGAERGEVERLEQRIAELEDKAKEADRLEAECAEFRRLFTERTRGRNE